MPALAVPSPAVAVSPSLDQVLGAGWALGVLATLVLTLLIQRRSVADVRRGLLGPAVIGVVAPRIVLPDDFVHRYSAQEQELVLAHERAHLARQDSRVNGLVVLAQCVCWFNPLIHLGAHLLRIDQELACDEVVISRFPTARPDYAQALVKAQLAIRPLPLGCYWPSGTEHPLVERLAMINRNLAGRARRLAGASALALLCAGASYTAWAAQPTRVVMMPARTPTAVQPSLTPATFAPGSTATVPDRPSSPETAPLSAVCITNICADGQAKSRSPAVAEAIARGDAQAVLAAGGTYQDAVAAIANLTAGAEGRPRLPTFLSLFQDTSDGSTIAQGDVNGRPGLLRTSPDGGKMLVSFDGAFAIAVGGAAMAALDAVSAEGQTYSPPPTPMQTALDGLRAQLTASGDTEGLGILDGFPRAGTISITKKMDDGTISAVTVTTPDGRSRSAVLPPGSAISPLTPAP